MALGLGYAFLMVATAGLIAAAVVLRDELIIGAMNGGFNLITIILTMYLTQITRALDKGEYLGDHSRGGGEERSDDQ